MCERRGAHGPVELLAQLSKTSPSAAARAGRHSPRLALDEEAPVSAFMACAPTAEGRCIPSPKLAAQAPTATVSCAGVGDGRRNESGWAGSAGSAGGESSTSSWTSVTHGPHPCTGHGCGGGGAASSGSTASTSIAPSTGSITSSAYKFGAAGPTRIQAGCGTAAGMAGSRKAPEGPTPW
ncbi:dachshund homolog 1-like [Hordeum vulgare subsp. vulgare]|uniref:dachshund homolog 1-like n=1 Tax=Hordeum vulgare subsp. vulgare TaxID=112509 RepID=UPI001D1A382A|nr:dachshund homolog 1-like [Hordeum vulgare subsp. vulgare]